MIEKMVDQTTNSSGGTLRTRPNVPAECGAGSALARLHAGILLIDDINAALAAHDTAVLVALFGGLEGINDLHGCARFQAKAPRGGAS